jgi:hypothetical protein
MGSRISDIGGNATFSMLETEIIILSVLIELLKTIQNTYIILYQDLHETRMNFLFSLYSGVYIIRNVHVHQPPWIYGDVDVGAITG